MARITSFDFQEKICAALLTCVASWALMTSGMLVAQQTGVDGSLEPAQEEGADPHEGGDSLNPSAFPPQGYHAVQKADTDLMIEMMNNPERFIGMNLEFTDGTDIGPIIDMRRKVDDLELYLVVDATAFFNDKTTYAVNIRDIKSYDEEAVYIPVDDGMHLKGMVYYPEDYTEVEDFNPEGYVVGEEE